MRILVVLLLLPLSASASEIYTRDGVTDGDTFYLVPSAVTNDDPVFQSWVTYSLMRSSCQLMLGGDNPARASSFDCEFTARQELVNAWEEKYSINQEIKSEYLETLSAVNQAGFLAEYTAHYFGRKHWQLPPGLRVNAFQEWRRQHLRHHSPETQITGSWNYATVVDGSSD
jgi:hypothetical protein